MSKTPGRDRDESVAKAARIGHDQEAATARARMRPALETRDLSGSGDNSSDDSYHDPAAPEGTAGSGTPPSGEQPATEQAPTSTQAQVQGLAPEVPERRGRGGYRPSGELQTIPTGVMSTSAMPQRNQQVVDLLTNFIRLTPMQEKEIFQYRIDFEPQIESVRLRSQVFRTGTKGLFAMAVIFDGQSDARCSQKLPEPVTQLQVAHPADPETIISLKIKLVGTITWSSYEMLRLYNLHMKSFLKMMGFFPVGKTGTYVHPELNTPIGQTQLVTIRGYKTSANVHEDDKILMNLESTHKLFQTLNVCRQLREVFNQDRNSFRANAKAQFIGKLVVTKYNRIVYKIDDINFDLKPSSTFRDERKARDVSYLEYYSERYGVKIDDAQQPMLLVTPNSIRARSVRDGEERPREIYLVPELCNIAGLTEPQRNDSKLKNDLIRSSQVPPKDRVEHMRKFLENLHKDVDVRKSLDRWGYEYDKEPVKIRGRMLPIETIGIGPHAHGNPALWPKVDNAGGFDPLLLREKVARAPEFRKLYILCGGRLLEKEPQMSKMLREGFKKIGFCPQEAELKRLSSDSSQAYVQAIRELPCDAQAALVLVDKQNKEKYDSIKKAATLERGLVTQVVTWKLMQEERKARGASVKIAVQLAAKLGGEPWFVNLPLTKAMICGYDTYHDSASRGRSYGAFMASMNSKFSRWWSKVDSHDALDELSSNMVVNLGTAMDKYRRANECLPDRIFIYRDGVGDGQLEHVFKIEVEQLKEHIKKVNPNIKLTFIVVNKRVGARFYARAPQGFINPSPGTVVDTVVTRKQRYDFYLVSQSTRHGTITPTYYNILADESGLDASKHQMMAYKLCFLYYNWTGTVRVPAPCQYAHKLALLCGEHIHGQPNVLLDDRLHFL